MWVMLIGLFAIMYFFMIRPQRKAQKEQQNFINSLQKGMKVVTAGGIYGTIAEVRENVLLIEIDKDVKIKVAKSSVQRDPAEVASAQAAKSEK
ncbi:MAG: preprotein translocase subunit YajC [Bacteroidales bacterium]|nr:preprotein translocase subunit YajC [Bacteroidales bacterium]